MNAIAILAAVNSAITIANAAIKAGQDAAPFIQAIYDNITGKGDDVTQEDLDALAAQVDALYAELQLPLPTIDEPT